MIAIDIPLCDERCGEGAMTTTQDVINEVLAAADAAAGP